MLRNEEHGAHRDALVMGAALVAEVTGEVRDPMSGAALALAAIQDGRAARLLENVIACGPGEIRVSDFLGLMAAASHARVGDLRAREPLSQLRARARDTRVPLRIQRQGRFDLIAEFKRRSPSAGGFRQH